MVETELRKYRRRLGLTQQQVAAMCGMHNANYASYETGKVTSSLVTTKNVAKGLGLSMEEVYNMVRPTHNAGRAFPTVLAGWQDLLGMTDEAIAADIRKFAADSNDKTISITAGNWRCHKGGSGIHSIKNIGTCERMRLIVDYFRDRLNDEIEGMSDDALRSIAATLKYGQPVLEWIDAGKPITWEYIYNSIEKSKRDLEIALAEKNSAANQSTSVN